MAALGAYGLLDLQQLPCNCSDTIGDGDSGLSQVGHGVRQLQQFLSQQGPA